MALLNHAYAKCFHFYLSFLFGVFIISLKVNNALCVFLCPSPIMSIFTLLQFLRYFQRFSATDRTSQSHFPLHLLNASERQPLISALKTSLLPTLCMFLPPAAFLRQTSCPRCLPRCGHHLLSLFLGFSPQSTEATADQHQWYTSLLEILGGSLLPNIVLDSLSEHPRISTKGALEGSVCSW